MDDRTPIEEQQYYHGLLPREDIRAMLSKTGDFIVRTTEPNPGQARTFVLSVNIDETHLEAGIKHFIIQHPGKKYIVEKYGFDSIPELISYFYKNQESVSAHSVAILKTPIPRQEWELSHDDIRVTKKLGEGAFGEVSLGVLRRKGAEIDVAIKLAKLESMTKEQIKELMMEARLMRMFDHPNVIKTYGVAAGREPLMIVLELADKGALDSYLKKAEQPITVRVEMCMGAAWGLEYLHTKNVIHRDVAARNCLYGGNKVKISDFGLTREGTIYEMDPHSKVPIRWLAPETLRTAIYSQKTDVFSYGVLCWEILMHGLEPYPGMTVAEVNVKVKEGYRMPLPPETPREFAQLIEKGCWTESPNDRLSMAQVCKKLEFITHLPRPHPGSARAEYRDSREHRRSSSRGKPDGLATTSREKRKRRAHK